MDPPRILMVGNVPVYLPAHLDTSLDYVAESLIQTLLPGNTYGCTQLADQSYQVQETIWSTLLSFIAFKRKTQQVNSTNGQDVQGETARPPTNAQANGVQGETVHPPTSFRFIYLCSGFQTLRMQMKLLDQLKKRLNVPDFENIITTAFAEPVNMCVNQKIAVKYKDSHQERNIACRSAVRCGRCPQYHNVGRKFDAPNFLTDLEDISVFLDRENICPYFTLLSRMDSAHLILTTYDALKGTLSGQNLKKEKLLLDENTFLICDDSFALEKVFEECFDFTVGVASLQRTMALCVQRKRNLWELQQSILSEPFAQRQEFYSVLRLFCELLDKMCRVIRGEISISPETAKGRLQILVDLGFKKIDPKSIHKILKILLTDIFFIGRFRKWESSQLIHDVTNIQQLFLNLKNSEISNFLFFSENEEKNPFRFWLDRQDDAADSQPDFSKLNFKFFGVSVNPVFAALRKKGLASLLCFGTIFPSSFSTIDPEINFRIRRLSLAEISRPIPNLFSGILAMGPSDVAFNCHSEQKEKARYIRALGFAIRQILEIIPGRILLLFPAMTYFESCSAIWKADENLRELNEILQVYFSCGGATCAICAANLEFGRSHAHCAVTFVRGATIDGVSGGFQAVLAISLPFQFLLEKKISAKKSFLNFFDRNSAFDFYTQEAVNAITAPFIKATSLDPLSVFDGRIFIVLDSRLQKQFRFLPQALQKTTKEYTTFEGAMSDLKQFLRCKIGHWDISQGVDLIDSGVFLHIRFLHKNVLVETSDGNRMEIIEKLFFLIEKFREEKNIDLLASGLLEAIQIERQIESSEFSLLFLPWILNFRNYFRSSRLREYWPIVIQNLFKQISEKIDASEETRLSFTLLSNSQYTWERCHVQ